MKKTLGILSAFALAGVAHAEVNVSGYVDGGYDWSNQAAGKASAFAFHEGGVWFSGNTGATSFLLDLSVRQTSGLTPFVQQGYVSRKHDNGFSWMLGRFDGLLGHDANDSVNNKFVHTGLLYNLPNGTPTTQTGLVLGYDLSDALKIEVVAANGTNQKGAPVTTVTNSTVTTSADRSFAYPALGFKVASKLDGLNAYVGGNFYTNNDSKGYVVDIGADTALGAFDVGAELLLAKAAVVNAASSLGFGIHGGTAVAEATKVNVELEWENGKNTGTDSKVSTLEVRVGPTFALSEALALKADYTLTKFSGNNAVGTYGSVRSAVAVAGIYKF